MDDNIKLMLDYIDSNITEKINMETLAGISFYSAIQVYRKFIAELNTTPMNYVKRRKLFFAAKDIIRGDKKISDIAFKYGFESHDVFIRVFKRFYDMTPTEFFTKSMMFNDFYRQNSYCISEFSMPSLQNNICKGKESMENWEQHKVDIVTLEEIKLIGVKQIVGEGEFAFDVFYNQYDRYFRNAPNRKYPKSTNATYAVSIMLGNGKHDYFVGVEVSSFDNVPTDVETLTLPEKMCAVIGYEGGLDYRDITDYLYDIWLDKSGYNSALNTEYPFCTIEYYSPNNDFPCYEERIYIPIEGGKK